MFQFESEVFDFNVIRTFFEDFLIFNFYSVDVFVLIKVLKVFFF